TIYPNGPINLKAVATFNDSRENQKLASVNVENSGPSVAFSTPVSGQLFNGDGIPVAIEILDTANPPVRVSFFRESATSGSLFLGEDTSEAFTSAFSVSDLPEGETVVIKAVATDALGRATTITVSGSVVTNQDPIAVCKNTTVYLDANGNASITASDVDDGSSDPDPSDSISLSVSPDSFDCSNIGSNAVILTVTDNQDASATCDAIVTVVDNLPPVPDTDPLPQVNGECSATIPAAPTATDNCAGTVTGTTGDPLSYSDQGSYTITWTFDDGNGNTSNQAQNVVVSDVTPPNVQTQNITVQLTADGSASITADAIDNGSTDNCCLGSKSISRSSFTCA
ncbi:MAG: hypothetical protein D3907_15845, partial [Candidatus Electrothrix sp. AUS3]|nr:hypothetical protein [Candidatus Electrothrix gigas]